MNKFGKKDLENPEFRRFTSASAKSVVDKRSGGLAVENTLSE